MNVADLYYVTRKLRALVEQIIVPREHLQELPLYHVVVLRDIVEFPGSTVQEISRRLSLAQSMVSKVAAEARERGWVAAEPDSSDRRKLRLAPSEMVREFLGPALNRDAADVLNQLAPDLPEEDRAAIIRTFELFHRLFREHESCVPITRDSGALV